jgi:hypothetical protein
VTRAPALDSADLARQSILLDALLGEIRHSSAMAEACYRWDSRLRMRDAELAFRYLAPHCTADAEAVYSQALGRTARVWLSAMFLRGVINALTRIGFPATTAALLAPRVMYVYLDWAGCHDVPPGRHVPPDPLPDPGNTRAQPPSATATQKSRGPRWDAPYETWAHWFYRVEVCGESQRAVAKHFGPRTERLVLEAQPGLPRLVFRFREISRHKETSIRAVRRALLKTRRLLGVPSARK